MTRNVNPYRCKDGRRAGTCLVRDLDAEAVDALIAPPGGPVRIGEPNPWSHRLPEFEPGEPFRTHDESSALARAMLGFGGRRFVLQGVDPDEADILARGQLWPGQKALLVRGRPCSCHENSSVLWEAHQDDLVLVTGYALSEDGLWRQHSWCVEGTAERRLIETTTRRLLYVGFGMDADEAAAFHLSNTRYKARLAPAPERAEEPSIMPAP